MLCLACDVLFFIIKSNVFNVYRKRSPVWLFPEANCKVHVNSTVAKRLFSSKVRIVQLPDTKERGNVAWIPT